MLSPHLAMGESVGMKFTNEYFSAYMECVSFHPCVSRNIYVVMGSTVLWVRTGPPTLVFEGIVARLRKQQQNSCPSTHPQKPFMRKCNIVSLKDLPCIVLLLKQLSTFKQLSKKKKKKKRNSCV